jgi:heme a synthase
MKNLNRYQKWALATTIATYFNIVAGGFVRASGAGLGCPDWPKCFGRYYPPTDKSQVPPDLVDRFDVQLAWIEYTNRLIGAVIGLLILGVMFYAIRDYRHNKRVLYPSIGAFLLVLVEGWLGGMVVTSELHPLIVTAHLVLALIISSLLVYATVEAFFPTPPATLPPTRQHLGQMVLALLLVAMVQMGLGANLRGALENIQEDHPNIKRSEVIHEAGLADQIHRSYSWLIVIGVSAIAYYTHRKMNDDHPWFKTIANILVALVVLQIGVGIGLAYGGLPPALQITHVVTSSVMIGVITLLYLLVRRLPYVTMMDEQGAIYGQLDITKHS